MAQQPPVNGRELVAEDVKFSYDRLLAEQSNTDRQMLESVDRIEVVDAIPSSSSSKSPMSICLMCWLPRAACGSSPRKSCSSLAT